MSNNRILEIDDDVRAQVSSADLDSKEMEYCVISPQIELREIVASNPKLTSQLAQWMSTDIEPSVRASVAGNPNLDPSIILKLSSDTHISVVAAAAQNPILSSSKLVELSKHRSYGSNNVTTVVTLLEPKLQRIRQLR